MKRQIVETSDGSKSIYLPDWNESYHSKHGAVQEAYHVFIRNGLDRFPDASSVNILEMGFGTGLNCFITFLEGKRRNLKIRYRGLEAYPVEDAILKALDYPAALKQPGYKDVFDHMHDSEWGKAIELSPGFALLKQQVLFEEVELEGLFDLVYFDAFGPRVQPGLWGEQMFAKMYKSMAEGGILVTYSAKGSVRRAMQSAGFLVERLPGPPGKREMLRAIKNNK